MLPAVGRSRYFYPRPPRGERLGAAPEEPEQKEISIHALREESDQYPCWRIPERRISIHALREESDKVVGALLPLSFNFYPRPPRGERPPASVHTAQQAIISIHALREESDPSSYFALYLVLYFYPRPPRGERRAVRTACALLFCKFLSTPSARRATMVWERLTAPDRYFYPRPPRGERPVAGHRRPTPHREYFYPRPPRGERRGGRLSDLPAGEISIHALREESDAPRSAPSTLRTVFLSTPSARRATKAERQSRAIMALFLSTPSARRATLWYAVLLMRS